MKYINEEYIYCGNLTPLKRILADVKEGRERSIAFLGASVTYGESVKRGKQFSAIMEQKWESTMNMEFAPKIVNASRSGTLSGNALFSMDEVLEMKPDLVFLDYSVNDPGQMYLAETFEAVVYRFLASGCAVAILLFCNERGTSTKGSMIRIARHYDIPIIDIGKLIMDQIHSGEMSWSDFALDYVHPNNWGHEYIADNLFQLFLRAEEQDKDVEFQLPEEFCFMGVFCDVQFRDCYEYKEEGWILEEEFSYLLIEYTQNPDGSDCAADVYVDDEYVRTITRYAEISWDNRVVHCIYEDEKNSRHKIKIVPARNHSCTKEEWEQMNIKFALGTFSDEFEEE